MKHLGKTPPFRRPNGEILQGSISEIGYFRLGGLDQWVMSRVLTNPPLILLFGGPGMTEMRFFRYFNAPPEHPRREEDVRETHAHHRHSLRRARCTSGG